MTGDFPPTLGDWIRAKIIWTTRPWRDLTPSLRSTTPKLSGAVGYGEDNMPHATARYILQSNLETAYWVACGAI